MRQQKSMRINKKLRKGAETSSSRNFFPFALLVTLLLIVTTNTNIREFSRYSSKQQLRRSDDDFAVAKKESLGFFDDISSHHWELLKKKVSDMAPNFSDWGMKDVRNGKMEWFYQAHFEPEFLCAYERRIGRDGDGGKWICDPHRIAQKAASDQGCLVYSVGSNNDFSFEMSVHDQISEHCEIHTFDFGDYSQGAKEAGDYITYHQVGVGKDQPPRFKSVKTLVKELGHENRVIDIFKIDCEGCEWQTAKHWFEAPVTLRQIQVELHFQSTPAQNAEFFDLMYENDYVVFHKEANIAYPGAIEYAFLKLSTEFSKDIVRTKAIDALPH